MERLLVYDVRDGWALGDGASRIQVSAIYAQRGGGESSTLALERPVCVEAYVGGRIAPARGLSVSDVEVPSIDLLSWKLGFPILLAG